MTNLIEPVDLSQVIKLQVNGGLQNIYVRNADTLMFVLREQLGIMSVKPGCENGDCGSCTVLVDGNPINACQLLAVGAQGHQITTLEGLEDHTLQEAFISHNALQCGYCTPGFILNAHALVQQAPDAQDQTIDEWLSSNICRCTGYQEIKEAVKSVLEGKNHGGG